MSHNNLPVVVAHSPTDSSPPWKTGTPYHIG